MAENYWENLETNLNAKAGGEKIGLLLSLLSPRDGIS
jgi:hypothetical protein